MSSSYYAAIGKKTDAPLTTSVADAYADDEYNLLLKKFGEKNAIDAIQELDNYIPNSQRKKPYRCHYRAICSWVIPKILEKNKFAIGKKSEASQQLVESFSAFSEANNEA